MKRKKIIAILAIAAGVSAAVLTGCALKKNQEPAQASEGEEPTDAGGEAGTEALEPTEDVQDSTQQEEPTETTGDTEDAGVSKEAKDELWALLCRVRDDVQPGTAGSSLKADIVAVALLQWGVKEPMSAEDAKAITAAFLNAQSDGFFAESIEVVDFACHEMQGDDVAALLDQIGMGMSDKTWGNDPLPLVEAVMEGAGLR